VSEGKMGRPTGLEPAIPFFMFLSVPSEGEDIQKHW